MPPADDLTSQLPELQSAVQHGLQETGAAGTGPISLPPPATITSSQTQSSVPGDAGTYSNTLTVQLYRDGDGKVWTQPGPGHATPNLELRVRDMNGELHVVMELTRVIGVVRRGTRVITTIRTDAMGSSGARGNWELQSDQGHGWNERTADGQPVRSSDVRNEQRFHQFSPHDLRTAVRQAIWAMQSRKAIYSYDPPDTNAVATANIETSLGVTMFGMAGIAAAALAAFLLFMFLPRASSPVIPPIHADFNQQTFTTTYSEETRGLSGATYEWAISIPSDPACAAGFKGNTPTPQQATWYHADTSEKGPCNHAGNLSGPSGHPGAVTVVITTAALRCQANYSGTNTGDGSPPQCLRK